MIYITKEAILVHEESIAIIILWALIFVYSILGSIDFGAGFWGMVYAKHPTLAAKLANRYLSPTWEVTNTFLVFVVVAFLGFFPKAAFTLATVMFVPVMLILVLVAIRSTFMVFAYLSAEVPTPSSYHFRYYRALNSSSINYRFTSYRRCLYYNV